MSITLKSSDELVAQLHHLAEITGRSIEEVVAQGIAAQMAQELPMANLSD